MTVDFKTLTKMVKKLNKLKLTDEIDLDDFDEDDDDATKELAQAYYDAFDDIDQNSKIDKLGSGKKKFVELNNEIVDFLEGSNKDDNSVDDDDLEDTLEEMEYKEFKKYVKDNELELKTELKKKTFDDNKDDLVEEVVKLMSKSDDEGGDSDDGNEIDEDAIEEELEDLSYVKAKKWLKEKGVEFTIDKDDWKDDPEDQIEEIIELMKKGTGKKDKKKDKKDKTDKKSDKPKGTDTTPFRTNSKQAKFYMRIEEGDCTVNDLALILNDDKKKDVDKKWNTTVHMLARKYGNKAPVSVTFGGTTVGEGTVEHAG